MDKHLDIYKLENAHPKPENLKNGHVFYVYFKKCRKNLTHTLRFLNIAASNMRKLQSLLKKTETMRRAISRSGTEFDEVLQQLFLPR